MLVEGRRPLDSQPAHDGKTTATPRRCFGQVHPIARSVSSHPVLSLQLNTGLQLLSTVSRTKTELLPCPLCSAGWPMQALFWLEWDRAT